MGEDALLWTIIGGVIVGAVLIVILANWFSARSNQRRADKMMKAKRDGTYDPSKKYMGNQGGWEPGDEPIDHNWSNRD